jgi:hypothetical protein
MAVKVRRTNGEPTWRCPACRDLGWVFEQGTTYGGAKTEVARRCTGPTLSGCPQLRHEDDRRPKVKAATRGRMD